MLENIRLSFQGIWAHKMRSFLTMLGIIIGIAAIIAIVSTIKGTNDQIKENIIGSGDNIVEVNLYEGEWNYVSGDSQTPENMPMINDSIKEEILAYDEIIDVAAYRYGSMYDNINYKGTSISGTTIIGVDEDYFSVMGYELNKGRLFDDKDRKLFKKVVILDNNAAGTLFGSENPIGKSIEMRGDVYVVAGIVEKSNEFAPTVENINDWYTYYYEDAAGKIYVTDDIWPNIYGFDEPYNLVIKPKDTEAMTSAGKKATDVLNSYMPVADDGGESLYKYKSEDLLEKAKELQDLSASTSKQLIWIASISLIVGGIGVMNIMLVSVTERTREIGLKKALGARKKVILAQFLTEAAVLTSLGGILGVGVGIGLAYLISDIAAVPVAISGSAIAISVVFSMVIGLVFGLIPSVKAANLNPIDALRYE
ncbi:MAG: FtsX-like permease family protein [Lachnospiraceae bacterium]|nr:FtsX-like permease family protein [Lachnospiraceae bacterium]